MLADEDHIHELRLELRCCRLTRRERKEAKAALAAALAARAERNRMLDRALAEPPEEGR